MKNLFFTSIFLVFLASCSEKERTIIVNTQNADGLTTETKLDVNGLEIGQVREMDLAKDGTVNLTCNVSIEPKIPVDSKFFIKDLGLIGGKGIGIKLGTKNKFLESGATVKMDIESSKNTSNLFTKKINGIIEKLNGTEQTDSLLYELRRLNENIEDLKLERKK